MVAMQAKSSAMTTMAATAEEIVAKVRNLFDGDS